MSTVGFGRHTLEAIYVCTYIYIYICVCVCMHIYDILSGFKNLSRLYSREALVALITFRARALD